MYHNQDDGFGETQRLLVHQYAYKLQSDPRALADMQLCAFIASGRIHKETTIYCLLRLLGERAMNIQSGKTRLNVSQLQGVSDEDLSEAGFFLSSTLKDKSSMTQFGLSERISRSQWVGGVILPNPFMSILDNLVLQNAVKISLENLGALYSRCFIVSHDETVFGPGYLWIQTILEIVDIC